MAVCDDCNYFENKVREDIKDWADIYQQNVDIEALNINVIDSYIGRGYGIAGKEIFDCIELVARSEGIVLDPVYSGKAFFAMLAEIQAGKLIGDNILFVHTGGIFGLLAQSEQYLAT